MEQCESFFNFFSPPQVPDEDDDIDEDAAEELQNLMEQDYDIGQPFETKLFLMLYRGSRERLPRMSMVILKMMRTILMKKMRMTTRMMRKNEEDDDDEEDEDESKTRKKPSAVRKKSGRALPGDGQQGERPPECKQQ
ncbi:Nucleosome assembly protein 1 [Sesamum angolense]|uniref:Nucleosome assembly protein 1 n=1 Tax=Sesamum angolense TaxID=2727404 RepID=A0AAE1WEC1_9LAMI|nr:Nucleosome assembly protein 1 [Sesamum angolense]